MKKTIAIFLMLMSVSALAAFPVPIVISELALPLDTAGNVQILYSPWNSQVLLRMRWQVLLGDTPTTFCLSVTNPGSTPPPGVPVYTWVPVTKLMNNRAYGKLDWYAQGQCEAP